MKLFKWITISILIIVISIILFQTFTQEIFTNKISLLIFVYRTPKIPVYFYVIGAFLIGLFTGLFVAVYNYFIYNSENRKNIKKIKQLKMDIDFLGSQNKAVSQEIKPSQMKTSTREIHELWEESDSAFDDNQHDEG